MIELRPYQDAAVAAVYQHLAERDDHPCVVIPTGGGKGVINFNFGSGSDSSIAYYAREQAGRPALSVASIYDLNAVDSRFGVGQGIWELSPVEADAVFIDSIEGSGRTFTLLIRVLTGDGQELYFSGASAPNNYTFADDVFETNISMSGGANLIVRSTDLSRDFKEELSDSIKLTLHIEQNGVLYKVPLGAVQKTGFYLDQRDNRRLIAAWAEGRRVLDLFSYHGGFALACLANGAAEVLAVDSSQPALEVAVANAEANEFDLQTLCADVFDALPQLKESGQYDLIICDPPKLAPRRADAAKALNAYRYLIAQCLDLLAEHGILLVASCSQAIGAEDLRQLLAQQGRKAGLELDVLAVTGQPSDHPWPVGFTTGNYLSAVIVERRG